MTELGELNELDEVKQVVIYMKLSKLKQLKTIAVEKETSVTQLMNMLTDGFLATEKFKEGLV